MIKKALVLIPLLIISVFTNLYSQTNNYVVRFKSGNYHPPEHYIFNPVRAASGISRSYAFVQFYDMPSATGFQNVKNSGIRLLEYISNFAYWASVPSGLDSITLAALNIRTFEPIRPEHKLDVSLLNNALPPHAIVEGNKADLHIYYFPDADDFEVIQEIKNLGGIILKADTVLHNLDVRIYIGMIEKLSLIESLKFIEPVLPPPTPENLLGRTSHRVNILQSTLTGERNLLGQGITAGVGDGGYVNLHADYQHRVINKKAGGFLWGNHEDHVTGTVAGNGNIMEDNRGMAPKARVIADIASDIIYNAPLYFNAYEMVVTNNSYGWGGELLGVYSGGSSDVDNQAIQYPHILHCIAAMNEGDFNSVGGVFAAAKNTITVGAVDPSDNISGFSSKGPVNDGRIKPEIVSVGEYVTSTLPDDDYSTWGGTSMATPGVTGSIVLLYQRYKQLKNELPNSALIKSLVCNTAEDLGNPGPDYSSGFGRINVKKAVEALEQNRYIQSEVFAGSSKTHSITVPSNLSQLKIMLYWKDPAGSEASAVALVNNLHLSVTGPSGTFLPWVLNPSQVQAPAQRGVDNLNNIEQVTISNPTAGQYNINVNGALIALGDKQEYFIHYEFVQKGIQLTYPYGGEAIEPSQYIEIRWDAAGNGPVNLEYSLNNGASWNTIAGGIEPSRRSYSWNVPSGIFSDRAIVRVSDGTYTSTSKATFTIMQTPVNLQVIGTPGNLQVSWNPVPNASSYDVFFLRPEQEEIQLIANTTSQSFTINLGEPDKEYWISVRARSANGIGKRSRAVRFEYQTISYRTPENPSSLEPQISYRYYEGVWNALPDFTSLTPVSQGIMPQIQISPWQGSDNFAVKYDGYFFAPAKGVYTFYLLSDEGSKLYIGNTLVVNNDFIHTATEKSGSIGLEEGYHAISIQYFERTGPEMLMVSMEGPSLIKSEIGNFSLHHQVQPPIVEIIQPLTTTLLCDLSPVLLEARATDPDGEVSEVWFDIGNQSIRGTREGDIYRGYWTPDSVGSYALYVSAFDYDGGRGSAITSFFIGPSVEYIYLADAITDQVIRRIKEGDTIYTDQKITLLASHVMQYTGSVRFMLNGQNVRIENQYPYALAGDNNGDFNQWKNAKGNYELKVISYRGPNGTGIAECPLTINFRVMDPKDTVRVMTFILIDTDTDMDIRLLQNNDVIIYNSVKDDITIRANPTVPAKSVRFYLNGVLFKTESAAPFALNGDNNGNYIAWKPTYRSYTLTARAYSGTGGSGSLLQERTIVFTVRRPASAITAEIEQMPEVYPNPATDHITIRMPEDEFVAYPDVIDVIITSKEGKVYFMGKLSLVNGKADLALSDIGLMPDLYSIRINSKDRTWILNLALY